jgi:hypothetical protein
MAKLNMELTPEELLKIIRAGALKDEIVKQHKTSEQELAQVLLPAYRKGELTKEEFNMFFQGLSLRPEETVEQEHLPGPVVADEQEEPSPVQEEPQEVSPEPRGGLARLFSRKSAPDKESEVDDEEPLAGGHDVLAQDEKDPASPEQNEEGKAAAKEEVDEALTADESVEAPPSPAPLEIVLARLDSIDRRLARIEEKVGLP